MSSQDVKLFDIMRRKRGATEAFDLIDRWGTDVDEKTGRVEFFSFFSEMSARLHPGPKSVL